MTPWRTLAVIMGRDLVARRRATLIATGVVAGIAVVGIVVAALATEGNTRPLRGADADRILGYLGVITLMFGLVFTGQTITEGVAEEKRSRVVEVVLGAVSPRRLMLGKVAAIGLIGFLQVMVLCAAVAVAGRVLDVFPLPEATAGALAAVLGFFILGFAFYAAVYAAAGAMVAPHENPASGTVVVNLVVMVGYLGGFISLDQGGGGFLRVLSLLPPTAPLTMPLRVVLRDVAAWEVALSAVLLLAAAWGVIVLAGRLYAGALMRGGKVRWREAWRDAAHLR